MTVHCKLPHDPAVGIIAPCDVQVPRYAPDAGGAGAGLTGTVLAGTVTFEGAVNGLVPRSKLQPAIAKSETAAIVVRSGVVFFIVVYVLKC